MKSVETAVEDSAKQSQRGRRAGSGGAKMTIKANFGGGGSPLTLGFGHTSAAAGLSWGRKLRSKPIFTWYEQLKHIPQN